MTAARLAALIAAAALTGGCAAGLAASAPPPSGISGIVVIGPTCPVERIPPDPQCADRPYAATLWFRDAASGRELRTARSEPVHGRFRAALAPGTYIVEPRHGAGIARPLQLRRTVRVAPHRFTALRIAYDSGIR